MIMTKKSLKTDNQLMNEYSKGGTQAFEILYQRHRRRLFAQIMSKVKNVEEAQEIFQIVFRKLHENRHEYDCHQPFLPWLFTISKNAIIDNRRKFCKENAPLIHPEKLEELPNTKDDFQIFEEGHVDDVPGFDSLSEREKLIIELKFEHELSFSEIAKELGLSEINSRKISSRAIHKLKNLISPDLR